MACTASTTRASRSTGCRASRGRCSTRWLPSPRSGPLNTWFVAIVDEGTGREFALEHNRDWLRNTRPIVEAFLHAKYFLEMVVQYGRELEEPPALLPSGWASVLYLYGLR